LSVPAGLNRLDGPMWNALNGGWYGKRGEVGTGIELIEAGYPVNGVSIDGSCRIDAL
jgi:hypothetical protein